MRFAHLQWLPAGLVACGALIFMWQRYDVRQQAALARFISAHLRTALTQSISVARRRAQRGLYLVAVALLIAALAGPLIGYRWEQISRRGNEIVFAIDTSRSMSTPDVKPNRLARAKLAIDDFANQLDGDAVGIVAFAGSAFLVCPLTLDYGAFHETLSAIDTNTISRGGTNISSAIHEAQAALRRRPGSDKILILVTDGEDLEGSALTAAETAKQEDGLRIFTVGVGTAGGDLIPIPPTQGGGFVKDETGAFVKSRLDEAALKAIATATGGFYVPLGTQAEGLETIFKAVLGPLAKHDLASRQQKIYIERYQWPLGASLGALLISLLIGTRRRVSAAARSAAQGATVAGLMLISLLVLPNPPAHAASGKADAAAAVLDPKKPALEYNMGTAAYRAGQFPQAAQAFQQSIKHAPSGDPKRLAVQENAYYNLGNTLYRTGQKSESSAPQETQQQWTDAVKAYETALQMRPNDADAKYNRDLVKRKIEALKQQQQQNQNKNNQQNPGAGKSSGQPPQGQPPQGQPPNSPQQPKADDSTADQTAQKGGQPPNAPAKGEPADTQHLPGQMSREEARELLDSAKSDEQHPPGALDARREPDGSPEKPIKDW